MNAKGGVSIDNEVAPGKLPRETKKVMELQRAFHRSVHYIEYPPRILEDTEFFLEGSKAVFRSH